MRREFVSSRRAPARALALATLIGGIAGCGQPSSSDGDVSVTSAVVIPGTSVLGFETLGAWAVSSGTVSLSTNLRTQGAAALAVNAPVNYTSLTSVALTSGLAPLASLTHVGATVKLDMQMPSPQPNPSWWGAVQLYISVPSQGVHNQYLGQKELLGQQLGTFQTYEFAVTDFVRTKLAGKTYADLKFTIGLNAPAGVTGKYIFDNLRSTSPATMPVGSVPGIDLVASVTQSPPANTPGLATFAAGGIQIPAGFHVKLGATGTGTAKLELGFGTTTNVTCTYAAAADKKNYVHSSCTTGNKAGDIVPAGFAKLTLVATDPNQAITKVRAQLSRNPLGDQLGTKLLPAIPTFWGDTRTELNTISMAWTNAVIATLPVSRKKVVNLPVPELAKRQGDGTPINVLDEDAPRPPNDPPFHFRGNMNNSPDGRPSGMFDAYYELDGSVFPEVAGTHLLTHFDAMTLVGVRVLEQNFEALKVTLTADTDNGGTGDFGAINPTGRVEFETKIFGVTVIHEEAEDQGSFHWEINNAKTVDTPPLQIWIFAVQAGIKFSGGVALDGNLLDNGFQLVPTYQTSVGVHVWGGVNLGIASGGVDATIEILKLKMPFTASATFAANNAPAVCAGQFSTTIDGALQLSAGGGSIDLTAALGVCPLCISGSLNIFSWQGLDLGTIQFGSPFPIQIVNQNFPLPPALCFKPLTVTINQPSAGTPVFAGVPVVANASATRPGPLVPEPVPCQFLTWTSSDPGAVFTPSAVGCAPQVKFSSTGGKTLTVTALNQVGETGVATINVVVSPAPAGAIPVITSPLNGAMAGASIADFYYLEGMSTGGTGTVTAVWRFDGQVVATQTVAAGGQVPLPLTTIPPGAPGPHTITLTVTDGSGIPNSASVSVTTINIK